MVAQGQIKIQTKNFFASRNFSETELSFKKIASKIASKPSSEKHDMIAALVTSRRHSLFFSSLAKMIIS